MSASLFYHVLGCPLPMAITYDAHLARAVILSDDAGFAPQSWGWRTEVPADQHPQYCLLLQCSECRTSQ